jgi:hypothetical protein
MPPTFPSDVASIAFYSLDSVSELFLFYSVDDKHNDSTYWAEISECIKLVVIN